MVSHKTLTPGGLSFLGCSLNDEEVIPAALEHIASLPFSHVLVVDGGSSDLTVEKIRESGTPYLVRRGGIRSQVLAGLASIDSEWVVLGELDHRFTPQGLKRLVSVGTECPRVIVGLRKRSDYASDFLSRCHRRHLEILDRVSDVMAVPNGVIFGSKSAITEIVAGIQGGSGYSYDTEFHESMARLGYQFMRVQEYSTETRKLSWSRFLRRAVAAGGGDAEFFFREYPNMSIRRRIQSLTHVFKRYGLIFPWVAREFGARGWVEMASYFWAYGAVRFMVFLRSLGQLKTLEAERGKSVDAI